MSVQEIISTYLTNGGIVLVIVLTLVEIAPIKIDPWTFILDKFGGAFNKSVHKELGEIKTNVNNLKETNDERYAVQCRIRILRFNDELIGDKNHSKDYYDQTLMDIDEYERYCNEHPDFRNNMTQFAIENIKISYSKCLQEHKFL